MANAGYYDAKGRLLDEANVPSGQVEYRWEELELGAQALADECSCTVSVWLRDEAGEPISRVGIEATPQWDASSL